MTEPSLGQQLNDMLSVLRLHEQELEMPPNKMSFLSLIWPLLPLLPPQPPTLVTELIRTEEKCDVCGLEPKGRPLIPYSRSASPLGPPEHSSGLRQRHRPDISTQRTPLEKVMADIEKKMKETLSSIENTTIKSSELSKKTKELTESGRSELSDGEMLQKLRSLVNQKQKHEERVKYLEDEEQHLKESLVTAINWANKMNTSHNLYDEQNDSQEVENVQHNNEVE